MNISELIEELIDFKSENGDIEVKIVVNVPEQWDWGLEPEVYNVDATDFEVLTKSEIGKKFSEYMDGFEDDKFLVIDTTEW